MSPARTAPRGPAPGALLGGPSALGRGAGSGRLTSGATPRGTGATVGYDWLLIAAALLLSIIGSALVYSATRLRLQDAGEEPTATLTRHVINLLIALTLAMVIARISQTTLRAYAPFFYAATVLALIVVLIPGVGTTVNGATAWIRLPAGFTVQPGELAKLGLLLLLASLLSEHRDAEDVPRSRQVIIALALAGVPMGLILLQPDLGTVAVVAVLTFAVIAVSGASWWWLAGMVGATGIGAFLVVQLGILSAYQLDRLAAFTDPDLDPLGAGYNTRQARIAIGAGGLSGTGLLQGEQTAGRFVPFQESDFIFTVAGEELGFLGSALVIALLGIIMWRTSRLALQAPDMFGRLLGAGVTAWVAFQSFESIGMALGIMPVTGVPLPFVAYGGTSMLACWAAIGLLTTVSRETLIRPD